MKHIIFSLLFIVVASMQGQNNYFTKEALAETFLSEDTIEVPFSEVLESYKGKTIFIDIWAGWCKDCIKGMPKVKELQRKNKDVVFLFLSLDKTIANWRKAIEVFKIKGEHYYISSGWEGAFCSSITLDWIPRYMIVNPEGEITMYKAIKADDVRISEALKK